MWQQHTAVRMELISVRTRLHTFERTCECAANEALGFYYVLNAFGQSSERTTNGALGFHYVMQPFERQQTLLQTKLQLRRNYIFGCRISQPKN